MKKSDESVFASAGGARFQYTLLYFWWPRRSAFSITPLSVVKTLTYRAVSSCEPFLCEDKNVTSS